jgi:hypothetical protein
MPRIEPRSRIRDQPVHSATQAPASHALQGATVEGVSIAHGGPPALGVQQQQRFGGVAQGRRPLPPLPPGPLPPQRRYAQAGAGLLGILSLERMGGWGAGIRGIQPAASWPSGWNLAQSVLRANA